MGDLLAKLAEIAGAENVIDGGSDAAADYASDEALHGEPCAPAAVVRPHSAQEVSAILTLATAERIPVTARGSGSGLSGAAVGAADGIVIDFSRMNQILSIDETNHTAVVQPGVTLSELEERTAEHGLVYAVYPGEMSATVGGNIATNAGGMRAVRYGVTRENVLGVQAVLPTGEIIRDGGSVVKRSSGLDLTQLILGSEGALALVTEATLKLRPRLPVRATLLAPFADLDAVTAAVPKFLSAGIEPTLLEYVDGLTMAAIVHTAQMELGIPDDVRDSAQAYLVVMIEQRDSGRLEADVIDAGELLEELGAVDVYSLADKQAEQLITARENAFWTGKNAGAAEIVDTVVPRGAMPEFMRRARELAAGHETLVVGAGHAGDGNVHLAIFQQDDAKLTAVMSALFELALELGGAISAEHGIGRAKKSYFNALEDPVKIDLMRRIKQSFDPAGILNPGVVFDSEPAPATKG